MAMYGLRMRPGAMLLAVVTAVAVCFAWVNFHQRGTFVSPDDGVTWRDDPSGIIVRWVAQGSPAERAGILPGDVLTAINGAPVHGALQVTRRLWHIGTWNQASYTLTRNGRQFEAPLVLEPANHSTSLENYLRFVGLLYLFIGFFFLAGRSGAPRAVHFYVFCLASFVLYSFHYTGKLNTFDTEIYWANVVALLLQPALLVHFALLFPERRGTLWPKLAATYALPALLLTLHIFIASGTLNFLPALSPRSWLDKLEQAHLGIYFLVDATIFLFRYRRAPSGVLRQQLKWVTGGTFAGSLPFLLFYIVPYVLGVVPASWMKLSVFSLALIPLCFGYAIIRYRLMDVDIIFKRGLAYTFATAAVVGIYFAGIALIGETFHTRWPTGPAGGVIAIVVAAFLFEPVRGWVQTRLDRFFYRDRLNYRRTLIEFGRALTNEVRLEPLVGSVLDRISQTLLVDRLAIFLEDPARPGHFVLSRSMGLRPEGPLDLTFLDPARPAFERGCLFFESARTAIQESESVRRTLEELDLNYFIPCRFRERTVAVLGLGKTVDGDYLSSDDLELLFTIAGYVAIAIENAGLYHSLEQKAMQIERLKDFSENIVESLNIGVVTVDLEDRIESWNPQLEDLLAIPRAEALQRRLPEVLPQDLVAEITSRAASDHVSGIYKFRLNTRAGRH